MTDPRRATEIMTKHFDQLGSEEFTERVERTSPGHEGQDQLTLDRGDDASAATLLRPRNSPLPLNAYLASALTGLDRDQRQLIFHISDIVSVICGEVGIDLYEPRKKTHPVHHQDVPANDVFHIDRERVIRSDLLIHLTHFPSTGSGEELDFAYNALVPIVLISHSETRVSRMVTGIPSFKLEVTYTEPEDLRSILREKLIEIRPFLEERKLAFSEYDAILVGARVRELREARGLTRPELAERVQLNSESLTKFEESTDRVNNPSLTQLRQLATVLGTTVADLVEPDLSEMLISRLQEWVGNRDQAARFGNMSQHDRNRIVRRLLLRIIDSLDDDEQG
jgi:transcriptional regulator with XRE-family HTH domain